MKAWIDGELVPLAEATVPILSHGFSRGSAIFEVMEVVATGDGAALFRADAHVARFLGSAESIHMSPPLTPTGLVEAIKAAVRANGVTSGGVKLFGYWSAAPEFGLIPKDPRVSVAVFCFDLPSFCGDELPRLRAPVTSCLSTIRKFSPEAWAVQAKVAGHYVNASLARAQAVQKGCDDAIMLDHAGRVAEGTLSNVFFVSDGVVRTPKLDSALEGVTRGSVIEVAKGAGIPVETADITPAQALAADEAFFTGSLIRIKPIRAIDGESLGEACPGPITRRLGAAFADACAGRDPRYAHWLRAVE